MDNFPVVADKIAHLKRFHTYLRDPKWFLNGAWPLGVCDAIAGCPKCPSSYVLPVAHLRQRCWVCAVLHCAVRAGQVLDRALSGSCWSRLATCPPCS
jgi:hypothetical protein